MDSHGRPSRSIANPTPLPLRYFHHCACIATPLCFRRTRWPRGDALLGPGSPGRRARPPPCGHRRRAAFAALPSARCCAPRRDGCDSRARGERAGRFIVRSGQQCRRRAILTRHARPRRRGGRPGKCGGGALRHIREGSSVRKRTPFVTCTCAGRRCNVNAL